MKRAIIISTCIFILASALIGCSLLAEIRGVTSQLNQVNNGMTMEEVKAKCGVPHFTYEEGNNAVWHYINLSSEDSIGHGVSKDYLLLFKNGKVTGKKEVTAEITRKKKRDSKEFRQLCKKAREEKFGGGIHKYCEDE